MNQNLEQLARDVIDPTLVRSEYVIQDKKTFKLSVALEGTIKEFQPAVSPPNCIFSVNKRPIGIAEAKRKEICVLRTRHEQKSAEYADAKIQYIAKNPATLVYGKIILHFKTWIAAPKRVKTALQLFYSQLYRPKDLSYVLIRYLAEAAKMTELKFTLSHVWRAYKQLQKVNGPPVNELIALVLLVGTKSGPDIAITSFDETVDKNFQN